MLIDVGRDAWKLAETCNKLGEEELLGQLTEECGELVQAAQKVRRARKGTTPVSLDDALVKLIEECAGVLLCIDALAEMELVDPVGMQFVGRYKNDRWYQRTVQKEADMDYKELIKKLRAHKIKTDFGRFSPDICRKAADAIETLLAEREAAVEDLHRMHTLCMDIGGCCPECGGQIDELMDGACNFCKGSGVACWKDDPKDDRRCAAFEWRSPTSPDRERTER